MKTYAPVEPAPAGLGDLRLARRLDHLIETFSRAPNRTIPGATGGDRNAVDAAHAFFANGRRVTPEAIVAQQVPDLVARVRALPRVVILHDTTEFHFAHHPA